MSTSTRVKFPNGDYVWLGQNCHRYYRKRTAVDGTHDYYGFAYYRGVEYNVSPIFYRVCAAATLLDDPKGFVPKAKDCEYTGTSLIISDERTCVVTKQKLVRFKACHDMVFMHPLEASEDRVYVVKEGTVSGWMPPECGDLNVWVDDTSSLSGYAAHSIVTSNSRVVNCSVSFSWVRGESNLADSQIDKCVIQGSQSVDSDILDCAVRRKSSIANSNLKHSSILESSLGSCWVANSKVTDTESILSVISNSTLMQTNFMQSFSLDSSITNGRIGTSKLKNSTVEDSVVYNSTTTDQSETHELLISDNRVVNTEPSIGAL